MILISSTKLYKLSEDERETLVTSKPLNFGNTLQSSEYSTESTLSKSNLETISNFRPSKELLLYPAKDFEKYQFDTEHLKGFSSTSDMLVPEIYAPRNMYKHLLMLSTQPDNYDYEQNQDESEENEETIHDIKEEFVYGKRKPSGNLYGKFPLIELNSYYPYKEKYQKQQYKDFGDLKTHKSKKKRQQHKQYQENLDKFYLEDHFYAHVPKSNIAAVSQDKPEYNLEENDWQQQKYYQKQKVHRSNNKYLKEHKYRHKGLDNQHGFNDEKKRSRRQKYRDHYHSGNTCNIRN